MCATGPSGCCGADIARSPMRRCSDASRTSLRQRSIPVVDDLAKLTEAPDIIHGSHTAAIIESIVRFPGRAGAAAVPIHRLSDERAAVPAAGSPLRRGRREYARLSGKQRRRARAHPRHPQRGRPAAHSIAHAAAAGPAAQRAHLYQEQIAHSVRRGGVPPRRHRGRHAGPQRRSRRSRSRARTHRARSDLRDCAQRARGHCIRCGHHRDGRARACRDGDARRTPPGSASTITARACCRSR